MADHDGCVWVDVQWTEYPRLVLEGDSLFEDACCKHGRSLEERCVACEGLSILSGTRR